MKKIFTSLAVLCYTVLSINSLQAQKIVAQKTFDIPSLGSNGNQNPLYLSINKSDGLIYFYATSHQNGDLWTIGKNDYQAYLTKHSNKTGGGKLLDNMLVGNAYQSQTFINAYELKLTKDLEKKGATSTYFRRSGPKSDTLLFLSKFGNIVSLDPVSKQVTGKENEVRSHIDDFNLFYKTVPKINDTTKVIYNINFKGEGGLGLKNIAPWLEKTSYINQYDPLIGFLPNSKKDYLFNLKNLEAIKDGDYVLESFLNMADNLNAVWFVVDKEDRKDRRNINMITFNNKGEVIKTYPYKNESSKRPILTNKEVFDKKTGKAVGLISVFGYDFSSDKKFLNPAKEKLTEFDVLYFDLNGELLWKTTFSHGDEKNYKHAFEPTVVFMADDKLIFLNSNRKSIFTINYEVLSLNNKGEKQMILTDENNTVFAKNEYVNNYISEKGHVIFDGENFWIYGFDGAKPEGQTDFLYKTMSIVKFDKDFKPLLKQIIPIGSNKNVEPTLEFLSNDAGKMKYLLVSGGTYNILTFGGEKGFENDVIKNDLINGFSGDPRTAFGKSYLVDKDARVVYLMHQGYTTGNTTNKVLSKILLTKVAY